MGLCMKFKKGELYKIKFYDHCTGHDSPFIFSIVGWVMKSSKISVVLTNWYLEEPNNEEDRTLNSEINLVLISTIIESKLLS